MGLENKHAKRKTVIHAYPVSQSRDISNWFREFVPETSTSPQNGEA